MFTLEEYLVLSNIEAESVDDGMYLLGKNLEAAEDEFTQTFLLELMTRIEILTDQEYTEWLDKASQVYV